MLLGPASFWSGGKTEIEGKTPHARDIRSQQLLLESFLCFSLQRAIRSRLHCFLVVLDSAFLFHGFTPGVW